MEHNVIPLRKQDISIDEALKFSEADLASYLLCAHLVNPTSAWQSFQQVPVDYFPQEGGIRDIAKAIWRIFERTGKPEAADVATIPPEVQEFGIFKEVTADSLLQLSKQNPAGSANAPFWAAALCRVVERRIVAHKTELLSRQMKEHGADAADMARQLRDLAELSERGFEADPWTPADVGNMLDGAPAERGWIFSDFLPRQISALFSGAGGDGKTMEALQWGVSVAIGRGLLPSLKPGEPHRVIMLAGEDPEDEIHRRIWGIAERFKLTDAERTLLATNLQIVCGNAECLIRNDGRGGFTTTPRLAELYRRIDAFGPVLVIVDPVYRYFGGADGSINSNDFAGYCMTQMQNLATAKDCTVVLLHHVNKDAATKELDQRTLGASNWQNGARWAAELHPLKDVDINKYNLDPLDKARYTVLKSTKSNYGPRFRPLFQKREDNGILVEFHPESDRLKTVAEQIAQWLDGGHRQWTRDKIKNSKELRDFAFENLGTKVPRREIVAAIDAGLASGILVTCKVTTGDGQTRDAVRAASCPF